MRSIIRATTAAVCLGLALAQGPPDPNADDLTCEVPHIRIGIWIGIGIGIGVY
jgi:hypothetical protein